jgi:hypothetical protein
MQPQKVRNAHPAWMGIGSQAIAGEKLGAGL